MSRELAIKEPLRARWRSQHELIVETLSPRRPGLQMLRVSNDGKVLATLVDTAGFRDATPSPDGRWVTIMRSIGNDKSFEVRDLSAGFEPHVSRVLPLASDRLETSELAWVGAWSPDSDQIALAVHVRGKIRGFVPTICVVARDGSGPGQFFEEGIAEPSGVFPLFWTSDGIYARSSRGLLRCSLTESRCTLLYSPGKARFIVSGSAVGESGALLLVQDHDLDPFEVLAKEIHRVDLKTGEGGVFLRLPDGTLLKDIDWIGEPADPVTKRISK
jgi:hypothetical protein